MASTETISSIEAGPDKTCLVTGGTSGIGFCVAERLVGNGCRVFITGRNADKGKAAEKRLGSYGTFIPCDITEADDVEALFDTIEHEADHLDYAVNNSGITAPKGLVVDLDIAAWNQVIATNLTGQLRCMQRELAIMHRRIGGAIVNVSSCAGVVPIPGQAAYVVSKAALNSLSQVAAIEAAKDQEGRYSVRVNAVAPGPTSGGMNSPERLQADPEGTARKVSVTAMKRFAKPEEIADPILFLLSEAAGYITGSVVSVDAGYHSGKF